MTAADIHDERVIAAADLVGRAGARQLQVGYLHDDVPAGEAGWYAHAQYQGARITEEDHPGPLEALEALARRLLTGARCKCGRLVALSDAGAVALPGRMVDGGRWELDDITAAGQCRWLRTGARWESSCEAPPIVPRRGRRNTARPRNHPPSRERGTITPCPRSTTSQARTSSPKRGPTTGSATPSSTDSTPWRGPS